MEKNIKNLQNEYSNKRSEYESIIKNFEDKKLVKHKLEFYILTMIDF